MKSVLISIQPKYCELIANGKKTIEVRKTRPKIETPFKCYIYMSQGDLKDLGSYSEWIYKNRMKVIGEFVCDEITEYRAEFTDLQYSDARHKKVCQNTIKWVDRDDENEETVYRYETSNEEDDTDNCKFLKDSCLTFNEVRKYIGETFFDKPFYGWHISDLKIYDKPKELSEFRPICKFDGKDAICALFCLNWKYDGGLFFECTRKVTRPPQSWCYVEGLE